MKRLLTFTALCLMLMLVGSAAAQSPDRILVTLAVPTAAGRTALVAQGYDVWSATTQSITLAVSQEQLQTLQDQGYQVVGLDAQAPADFPPDFDDYHDYGEVLADLQYLASHYPTITRLQDIGGTWERRRIWAIRITDHPQEDEAGEKGILLYGGTHAREHLSVEQALFVAHDLLENYGREGEATNLIDQRDIWIIPNLNPDGSEYDINWWTIPSFPPAWRKNRRDNGGSWGVDLNRNFGYKWGLDNQGSSPLPNNQTYRGPSAFSEPENQALRDFVQARPNLSTILSFHTYGELILYPYGYTYADLPPDMDATDFAIFQALAGQMAARNGFTAQQASDLYLVNGDHDDWFYGALGIYAMTLELYPITANPGFYPPDNIIPAQTARNRTALRYAIAMADDPAKTIDQGADMTPPAITLLSPLPTDVITEAAPISVTVAISDNVGVTTVEYLLDGQAVAVQSSPAFSATLALPAGEHSLRARAYDAAHWSTLSPAVIVIVDEAPTPTPTSTPTFTPTPTETPTPTPTETPTPTLTPTLIPGERYLLRLDVTVAPLPEPPANLKISQQPLPEHDGRYAAGAEVTLTAPYTTHYECKDTPYVAFISWSGDASGNEPTISIIMDADKHVTANYSEFFPPLCTPTPTPTESPTPTPTPLPLYLPVILT
ncbi:MAG: hypothetical protein K1X65_06620 [Caldilineales bacterium]|nr:hypothetical protein [Caldilineales bacterium]